MISFLSVEIQDLATIPFLWKQNPDNRSISIHFDCLEAGNKKVLLWKNFEVCNTPNSQLVSTRTDTSMIDLSVFCVESNCESNDTQKSTIQAFRTNILLFLKMWDN